MRVQLEHKQSGKKIEVNAAFFDNDLWLEVRPPRSNPMTHRLDRKDVPAFFDGKQVSWSYTYFVTLVKK